MINLELDNEDMEFEWNHQNLNIADVESLNLIFPEYYYIFPNYYYV